MMWRREEPADLDALRTLAAEIRQSFPDLDSGRDLEWVAVGHGWPGRDLAILVARENGKVVGFVALPVNDEPIDLSLGPVRLFRTAVKHHRLIQDIAVAAAEREAATQGCLDLLSTLVRRDGVVLAHAVPVDSLLHRVLTTRHGLRLPFRVLRWGGEKLSCRIAWTGDYETYLASLGKVSRKELRRNARALLGDAAMACEVRVYRTPAEAEIFLQHGMLVSEKTYQRRDLGLGLFAGGNAERAIRFAASVDALRGCILYINGAPVAFEYGFIWAGVCAMRQAGYDPAWARSQVGSVLFSEFIRGCESEERPIHTFDLMPGLNLFKLRTTNEKIRIQHFRLFPRSVIGTARYAAIAGLFTLTRLARRLLGRQDHDQEHSGRRRSS